MGREVLDIEMLVYIKIRHAAVHAHAYLLQVF